MRVAHIKSGVVVNVSLGDTAPPGGVLLPDHSEVAPGDHYDGTTFSPPPGLSLEFLKAAKHAQIERDRDAACYANINVIGFAWQADPRSQSLMATAILLAQAGVYTPSVWRTASNVDVAVTIQDLVLIAGSIAAQTQVAYAASWARKQALEAATTAEEVAAV